MTGIDVKRDRVVWTMDAWTARQLSYILDREAQPLVPGGRGDAGWRDASDELFAAADQIERQDVVESAASQRMAELIGDAVVRLVHPDWPR
jgi:hypothetical protein